MLTDALKTFRRSRVQLANLSERKGLFGFEGLNEPNDWLRLASRAVAECKELVKEVERTPPSPQTIQLLDDISDTVCQVHDSAEFCRNVHSDMEWQKAAHLTCLQLGGYVSELNANKVLYDALCSSLDYYERLSSNALTSTSSQTETEALKGYSREAVHVGRLLKRDMDKAGISLGEKERTRIMNLHSTIYSAGTAFTQNLAEDIHMRTTKNTQNPHALLYSRFEADRRKGWEILKTTPKENLSLVDILADSRSELAHMLGSSSYAEYALDSSTLAGNPDAVVQFLAQLHQASESQVMEEVAELKKIKLQISGGDSNVYSWDRDLCVSVYKAKSNKLGSQQMAQCSIQGVLKGFKEIIAKVFEVTVDQIPLEPGEAWSDDIIKLGFLHPQNGPLGHVYIDSRMRPGKFSNCAHFTLRCRRKLADGQFQLPLVALAFNFESEKLSPFQARTVFHELGHAMHSILCETQFQHLAGTRGPLDMIEIPSHFFEHFLTSSEGLKICFRDDLTGEVMPDSFIYALQRHWNFLPALEMNDAIVHSMVDQVVHGKKENSSNLSSLISQTVEKFSPFPGMKENKGIHHHLRFGHLVGYPASYYSYVYAKFIADTIWQKYFQNDPFNRDAGKHVQANLLSLGGSMDPRILLEELLGKNSLQSIAGGWAPKV